MMMQYAPSLSEGAYCTATKPESGLESGLGHAGLVGVRAALLIEAVIVRMLGMSKLDALRDGGVPAGQGLGIGDDRQGGNAGRKADRESGEKGFCTHGSLLFEVNKNIHFEALLLAATDMQSLVIVEIAQRQ